MRAFLAFRFTACLFCFVLFYFVCLFVFFFNFVLFQFIAYTGNSETIIASVALKYKLYNFMNYLMMIFSQKFCHLALNELYSTYLIRSRIAKKLSKTPRWSSVLLLVACIFKYKSQKSNVSRGYVCRTNTVTRNRFSQVHVLFSISRTLWNTDSYALVSSLIMIHNHTSACVGVSCECGSSPEVNMQELFKDGNYITVLRGHNWMLLAHRP